MGQFLKVDLETDESLEVQLIKNSLDCETFSKYQ